MSKFVDVYNLKQGNVYYSSSNGPVRYEGCDGGSVQFTSARERHRLSWKYEDAARRLNGDAILENKND